MVFENSSESYFIEVLQKIGAAPEVANASNGGVFDPIIDVTCDWEALSKRLLIDCYPCDECEPACGDCQGCDHGSIEIYDTTDVDGCYLVIFNHTTIQPSRAGVCSFSEIKENLAKPYFRALMEACRQK
jgi:hypothetical protein